MVKYGRFFQYNIHQDNKYHWIFILFCHTLHYNSSLHIVSSMDRNCIFFSLLFLAWQKSFKTLKQGYIIMYENVNAIGVQCSRYNKLSKMDILSQQLDSAGVSSTKTQHIIIKKWRKDWIDTTVTHCILSYYWHYIVLFNMHTYIFLNPNNIKIICP